MSQPFSLSRRHLLIGGAVALCAPLFACTQSPPPPLPFKGNDITGTHLGQDLDMNDASGTPRTLADYRGKVLMVFFGYTHCPDVCPTSMAQAAMAMRKLGEKAADVRVIMITVDPERDTAKVLQTYVKNFDPDFIGLTGSPRQLEKTARSFKASYTKEPGPAADQYTMSHSSAFYLLDREGEARALLSPAATPDDMVHDIDLLL